MWARLAYKLILFCIQILGPLHINSQEKLSSLAAQWQRQMQPTTTTPKETFGLSLDAVEQSLYVCGHESLWSFGQSKQTVGQMMYIMTHQQQQLPGGRTQIGSPQCWHSNFIAILVVVLSSIALLFVAIMSRMFIQTTLKHRDTFV